MARPSYVVAVRLVVVLVGCLALLHPRGKHHAEAQMNLSCPLWIVDYQRFHQQQRGRPQAKYLIHEVDGIAGGVGDRLRGMMFAVRVAHASQRVVLFDWAQPYQLTHFFSPNGHINWTLEGLAMSATRVLHCIDVVCDDVKTGAFLLYKDAVISIRTNSFMDNPCVSCPDLAPWSRDAVCLWHTLFRPNADITAQVYHQLSLLYSRRNVRYAAIHLRLGGSVGEAELTAATEPVRYAHGPLKNFLGAIKCVHALAKISNIDLASTPILLITDNLYLRQFVGSGHLPGFVTPSLVPVHVDKAANHNLSSHKTTFVDLTMLGKATALVTSPSGFSHQAWLLGGGTNYMAQYTACV